MFTRITIQMAAPLCNCGEYPTWAVGSGPSLILQCPKCKTKLEVPREKFVANFDIKNFLATKEEPKKIINKENNVITGNFGKKENKENVE